MRARDVSEISPTSQLRGHLFQPMSDGDYFHHRAYVREFGIVARLFLTIISDLEPEQIGQVSSSNPHKHLMHITSESQNDTSALETCGLPQIRLVFHGISSSWHNHALHLKRVTRNHMVRQGFRTKYLELSSHVSHVERDSDIFLPPRGRKHSRISPAVSDSEPRIEAAVSVGWMQLVRV